MRAGLVQSTLFAGALLAIALCAAQVAGGCEPQRACYEGDFIECKCEDGQHGYQPCDTSKDAWGECGLCGAVPGSAAASSGAGGGDSTSSSAPKLGFMETCESDEQCESGLCYNFNAKGPHCTFLCQTASDCPPPSPGCNNMGVCKAP